MRYSNRAEHTTHPLLKELFFLMEEKETNLSVAADLVRADDILKLAEDIGDDICVFKTHIDIVEDFSLDFIEALLEIKKKKNFLLFEDRKFADIGNTVRLQYEKGIYHISDWADIINAHTVPGTGVIEGLQTVGLPKQKGLLLLAQMSSEGTLAEGEYTQKTVEMALAYKDFVIGFIGQQRLIDDPSFIVMTPGVQLEHVGDALGQQYNTPEQVIAQGSDIIIVGRGIYEAVDTRDAAKRYREAGWSAYQKMML